MLCLKDNDEILLNEKLKVNLKYKLITIYSE
jgi:hypothetical protein